MSLQKEINEAIEKDLPNQIGKQLKERLVKADQDEKELKRLTEQLERTEELLEGTEKRLSFHGEISVREDAVTKREESVSENERDLKVAALEIKLEESEKRADMVMGFTATLVRNTTFRKNTLENVGMVSEYNSSTCQYDMKPTGNNSSDETHTEE